MSADYPGRPGPFDDCDPQRLSEMSEEEYDRRMAKWRAGHKPWHDSEWWQFTRIVRGIGVRGGGPRK
jgi:hypothetical protein